VRFIVVDPWPAIFVMIICSVLTRLEQINKLEVIYEDLSSTIFLKYLPEMGIPD
jgi:hypothetical protein